MIVDLPHPSMAKRRLRDMLDVLLPSVAHVFLTGPVAVNLGHCTAPTPRVHAELVECHACMALAYSPFMRDRVLAKSGRQKQ